MTALDAGVIACRILEVAGYLAAAAALIMVVRIHGGAR